MPPAVVRVCSELVLSSRFYVLEAFLAAFASLRCRLEKLARMLRVEFVLFIRKKRYKLQDVLLRKIMPLFC